MKSTDIWFWVIFVPIMLTWTVVILVQFRQATKEHRRRVRVLDAEYDALTNYLGQLDRTEGDREHQS